MTICNQQFRFEQGNLFQNVSLLDLCNVLTLHRSNMDLVNSAFAYSVCLSLPCGILDVLLAVALIDAFASMTYNVVKTCSLLNVNIV